MGRTPGYIALALLLCLSLQARAQAYDSVYLAKVKDSVERYYRLHPRQRLDREERTFRVQPLYGVTFTEETRFTAMAGFMGMYRTSADSLVRRCYRAVVRSGRALQDRVFSPFYKQSQAFLGTGLRVGFGRIQRGTADQQEGACADGFSI